MKTALPQTSPRKIPMQSRSRERVERILDAAAHVFADAGYEMATTDAIAERAEVSIGSLYQFFPNKQALFDALARRYLDRASVLFESLLEQSAGAGPWTEVLDLAIDGFAALDTSDANLRAILRNWHVATTFVVAGDALNREFARRAETVLAKHARRLPKAKRKLVATVIIEVISAMLLLVARRRDARAALLDETKVLLRRYLEPYTGEPSRRGAK